MSAEADQFLARITTPDTYIVTAYTNFIDALNSAGIWALTDYIHIGIGQVDATSAGENAKSDSTSLTVVGAPTFAQASGYTFDGVDDRLDTNWNPSTAGGNWTQNSGCMWAYCATAGITASALIGSPTDDTRMFPNVTGNAFFRMNTNDGSSSVANTGTAALWSADRSASNTQTGYKNGSSIVSSNAHNSKALFNEDVSIAMASTSFIAANIPVAGFGASLNGTKQGQLNAAVVALLSAIAAGPGANIRAAAHLRRMMS